MPNPVLGYLNEWQGSGWLIFHRARIIPAAGTLSPEKAEGWKGDCWGTCLTLLILASAALAEVEVAELFTAEMSGFFLKEHFSIRSSIFCCHDAVQSEFISLWTPGIHPPIPRFTAKNGAPNRRQSKTATTLQSLFITMVIIVSGNDQDFRGLLCHPVIAVCSWELNDWRQRDVHYPVLLFTVKHVQQLIQDVGKPLPISEQWVELLKESVTETQQTCSLYLHPGIFHRREQVSKP